MCGVKHRLFYKKMRNWDVYKRQLEGLTDGEYLELAPGLVPADDLEVDAWNSLRPFRRSGQTSLSVPSVAITFKGIVMRWTLGSLYPVRKLRHSPCCACGSKMRFYRLIKPFARSFQPRTSKSLVRSAAHCSSRAATELSIVIYVSIRLSAIKRGSVCGEKGNNMLRILSLIHI